MTDDWFDFLIALLDAEARFLVVGAHALAVHGIPRGTQDLDVWIDTNPGNVERVWRALATFGAPVDSPALTMDDLRRAGSVVQIGLPPNRIDVLTSISGIPEFGVAWEPCRARRTWSCHSVHRPRHADSQQARERAAERHRRRRDPGGRGRRLAGLRVAPAPCRSSLDGSQRSGSR